MKKIKGIFCCGLAFAITLPAVMVVAESYPIKNVNVFRGECQSAQIFGSDKKSACRNNLVIITNQDNRTIFSFEVDDSKYSFISASDLADGSKVEINTLDIDENLTQVSGECVISPSLDNPQEINCSVLDSAASITIDIEMSSLESF